MSRLPKSVKASGQALTLFQRAALRRLLIHGSIGSKDKDEVLAALHLLGFSTALELSTRLYQLAIGQMMNEVVGVKTPLFPKAELAQRIDGLLEQMFIGDPQPLAQIFKNKKTKPLRIEDRTSPSRRIPHPEVLKLRLLKRAQDTGPLKKQPARTRALEHLAALGLLRFQMRDGCYRITRKGIRLLALYPSEQAASLLPITHVVDWMNES